MVFVRFRYSDRVAVVVCYFDISTHAVNHLLERNLIGNIRTFSLVDGIFTFQHQIAVILFRAGVGIESTLCETGGSGRFVVSLLVFGINFPFRVSDQLIGIRYQRLDGEELGCALASSHRNLLDREF